MGSWVRDPGDSLRPLINGVRGFFIWVILMCGIVALFDIKNSSRDVMRKRSLEMIKKLRHRGPDWSGIFTSNNAILAHERLCVVDVESGKQPIRSINEDLILTVNGEIYNHKKIRDNSNILYNYTTNSDCEVILSLYKNKGINFLNDLSGIFAFALYVCYTQGSHILCFHNPQNYKSFY